MAESYYSYSVYFKEILDLNFNPYKKIKKVSILNKLLNKLFSVLKQILCFKNTNYFLILFLKQNLCFRSENLCLSDKFVFKAGNNTANEFSLAWL